MTKPRRPGARKGSPAWKARIAAGVRTYNKRVREAARIAPRDLDRLRRSGTVARSLRPLIGIAEQEAGELIGALGGPEVVTPQRRMLIEDVCAVGIILRAELARYLQSQDSEAGGRVGTLAGARRATLAALGLDAAKSREFDVDELVRAHAEDQARERAAQQESANGSGPDPESREVEIVAGNALQGPSSATSGDTSVGNGEDER